MSAAASGIASSEVDGYVAVADLAGLERAFLLVPAPRRRQRSDPRPPESQRAYPDSKLQLAADLADYRGRAKSCGPQNYFGNCLRRAKAK